MCNDVKQAFYPGRTGLGVGPKRICRVLLTGLMLGVLVSGPSRAQESFERESQPPNVVFFITDDMLPDMFNCLNDGPGRVITPNLDRLAEQGTLMMGQHVVSPVCTPSRYNCLTGRYASRAISQQYLREVKENGQSVVQWNTFIVPGQDTLPKRLQAAGYATGMVGKNHVVEAEGLHRLEWESSARDPEVIVKLKENAEIVENAVRASGFDFAENLYHNNPAHNGVRELAVHNMDWVTQAGLDFIDQNADRPFFLYFATTIPHGPQEGHKSWNADPTATAEGYLDEPLDVQPSRETIPKRLAEQGLTPQNNLGNLLWLDDALGALTDRLEHHQIADNTIIVFFNDHGQMAKGTVYQGGVHNPSILWRKKPFAVGHVDDTLVSNIDFAPTILDWCDVPYDFKDFDGQSFASILDGDSAPRRDSLYFELGFLRAIRQGELKYIALRYPPYAQNMNVEERQRRLDAQNVDLARRERPIINTDPYAPFSQLQLVPGGGDAENRSIDQYPAYHDPDQLYNLTSDPQEQDNLVHDPARQKDLVNLKAELQRYLANLPGGFAELKSVDESER